ncbi:MAG: hypothetical protein KDA54_17800 [Phycisphaerales bacterium]|nr:hypothetical protein [Phycisphaerales bacterium]
MSADAAMRDSVVIPAQAGIQGKTKVKPDENRPLTAKMRTSEALRLDHSDSNPSAAFCSHDNLGTRAILTKLDYALLLDSRLRGSDDAFAPLRLV